MVAVQAGNHYFVDSILGIWGGRPDSCHLYLAHLQQLVSSAVLAICTLHFQPIRFWMAEVSAALTAKAPWIVCGLTFCQHSWKYSFLLIKVDFATLGYRTVEDFDDWTSWLFYKGGVGVKVDYSWEAWWFDEQVQLSFSWIVLELFPWFQEFPGVVPLNRRCLRGKKLDLCWCCNPHEFTFFFSYQACDVCHTVLHR